MNRKHLLISVIIISALFFVQSCDLFNEVFGDEYLEEVVIPKYSYELRGTQIVFSPDGYGGLSSVDYTFINETDVIGNNSDNVSYSGITWDLEIIDDNSSLLTFTYESGGYEEYILHNKLAPEYYEKQYYYEYTGYTGYATYTYDGSWDYPDLDLQHETALVTLYVKDTNWDAITLTVDGVQKASLTSFPDVYIGKFPMHTTIDIDLDYTAAGSSPYHRDFICDLDSFGWWAEIDSTTIRYYPADSAVE